MSSQLLPPIVIGYIVVPPSLLLYNAIEPVAAVVALSVRYTGRPTLSGTKGPIGDVAVPVITPTRGVVVEAGQFKVAGKPDDSDINLSIY
jgi:hypothetical protein